MKTLILADRKATSYKIVCQNPDDHDTAFAAKELASYLEKCTNTAFSVITADEYTGGSVLFVGKKPDSVSKDLDELGTDGFVIRTEGENIHMYGNCGVSTQYAIYSFLEKFADCRFYTSKFEITPTREIFTVPHDINIREVPVFKVRHQWWHDYSTDGEEHLRFRRKRKCNPPKWAGGFYHTLDEYSERGLGMHHSDPCLFDDEVFATVLKNVRRKLRETPDAEYVSVSQSDIEVEQACHCNKCTEFVKKTGSYAGIYVDFANRIADAIKDEFPNVKVHTFAYMFTRQTPLGIVPRPNVMVQLCTIEACFRHPLKECTKVNDPHMGYDSFLTLLEKWGAITDFLGIWDYTTNYNHYSITYPNFDVLHRNIRTFADVGAKYLFEQGNREARNGEFCELRGYLIAHLMWNPYMTDEEYRMLIEEFTDGYYGKIAGAKIREYIGLAMKSTEALHVRIRDTQAMMYPNTVRRNHPESELPDITAEELCSLERTALQPYLTWFTELVPHAVLREGKRLFDEALALTDDPVLREHIENSSLQVVYLESFFRREALDIKYENLTALLDSLLPHTQDGGEERKAYIADIVNRSFTLDEEEYAVFNRSMIDAMLSHGDMHLSEVRNLAKADIGTLHLDRNPLGWW